MLFKMLEALDLIRQNGCSDAICGAMHAIGLRCSQAGHKDLRLCMYQHSLPSASLC